MNDEPMAFAASATEVLTSMIVLLIAEFARADDKGNYPAIANPLSANEGNPARLRRFRFSTSKPCEEEHI